MLFPLHVLWQDISFVAFLLFEGWLKRLAERKTMLSPGRLPNAIADLEAAIADSGQSGSYTQTLEALAATKLAVAEEFEVSEPPGKRSKADTDTLEKAQRRARRQTADRSKLKEQLQELQASRDGNQIKNLCFVQVGLPDPLINKRQLAEQLRALSIDGKSPISASSICSVRDAFAEVLKQRWGS